VNRGHSIDAEWIMEKKDWRQSIRQERDAGATQAGSSNTTSAARPANISSPQGTGADGADDDTNAYRPEMDEMRCLLWAHGGSFHVTFLSPSLFLIFRWILFRERGSGEVRKPLSGNN